jgi:hypothetical protein
MSAEKQNLHEVTVIRQLAVPFEKEASNQI